MAETVSKRRAIEVVLSSVQMSKYAAQELAVALQDACRKDQSVPVVSAQICAQAKICVDDLEIHHDFTKKQMISRTRMARERLQRIIEETEVRQ